MRLSPAHRIFDLQRFTSGLVQRRHFLCAYDLQCVAVGEFGPEAHSLAHPVLRFHGLMAFVAMIGFGLC